MIREVKMFPLLAGARGAAPRDLGSLADTVLRISQLSERHPRIAEMDINPLVALPHGVMAVDARIQLAR
jgi:acetyltransferase